MTQITVALIHSQIQFTKGGNLTNHTVYLTVLLPFTYKALKWYECCRLCY